jgi:hypothetical protein
VYAGIAEQQLYSRNLLLNKKTVTCGARTTLYSAALASPATLRQAFRCGLDIYTEDYDDNECLWLMAGLHADIETLAILEERGMPLNDTVMEAVALSGRLDVLQHLVNEYQCETPSILSHYAARSGSISILEWLRDEASCPFNRHTCSGAAQGGHLAALKNLRSEGCDWVAQYITGDAASSGSVAVVQWLQQQQRIKFGASSLKAAAGAGQTAMCEYLRSIGCSWDADTCARAATGGHRDTLHWLRQHGCPWNVSTVCASAATAGFTNVLDYLIQQGAVLSAKVLRDALNAAGTAGALHAAQWLRQHGAQWPAVLGYDEEQQWSDAVIAWAREQGCTAPVATADSDSDPDSEFDFDLDSEFDSDLDSDLDSDIDDDAF